MLVGHVVDDGTIIQKTEPRNRAYLAWGRRLSDEFSLVYGQFNLSMKILNENI